MRILPLATALLLAPSLPAVVSIEEQGAFVKIKEIDGGETIQLLYLKKRDISAVTFRKTGFNAGELSLIMHYRGGHDDDGAGIVAYHIAIPPNSSGDSMADRIIRMVEPDIRPGERGTVIKREIIPPPRP